MMDIEKGLQFIITVYVINISMLNNFIAFIIYIDPWGGGQQKDLKNHWDYSINLLL